jgi:hypothetical protein
MTYSIEDSTIADVHSLLVAGGRALVIFQTSRFLGFIARRGDLFPLELKIDRKSSTYAYTYFKNKALVVCATPDNPNRWRQQRFGGVWLIDRVCDHPKYGYMITCVIPTTSAPIRQLWF